MAHKRALIVGINYVGKGSELRGCINDAKHMEALLKDHFGFTDIKMVLEQEATTQGIKDSLRWLVSGCRPGDTLFFHYSGHGSQIADTSDADNEPDALDEIICPIDLDWREKVITDDYMKWVFDTVPAGVNLLVFLDSCHSGGALDHAEQYQPIVEEKAQVISGTQPGVVVVTIAGTGRYLAPPADVQALIDLVNLKPKDRSVQSRDIDKTGLLLSGCRSDQTSADANIDGIFQGAATASLLHTMKKNEYKLTHKELVEGMNHYLASGEYGSFYQRPQLDGSTELHKTKVFATPEVSTAVVNDYVPVDVPAAPPTVQNTETVFIAVTETVKKKNLVKIIGIVVGVIVAALFAWAVLS